MNENAIILVYKEIGEICSIKVQRANTEGNKQS